MTTTMTVDPFHEAQEFFLDRIRVTEATTKKREQECNRLNRDFLHTYSRKRSWWNWSWGDTSRSDVKEKYKECISAERSFEHALRWSVGFNNALSHLGTSNAVKHTNDLIKELRNIVDNYWGSGMESEEVEKAVTVEAERILGLLLQWEKECGLPTEVPVQEVTISPT